MYTLSFAHTCLQNIFASKNVGFCGVKMSYKLYADCQHPCKNSC